MGFSTTIMKKLNPKIEEVRSVNRLEFYNKSYSGKWVLKFKPQDTHELPEFATIPMPRGNGWVLAASNYINKAMLFPSEEAAMKFIELKQCFSFQPHCFNSIEDTF